MCLFCVCSSTTAVCIEYVLQLVRRVQLKSMRWTHDNRKAVLASCWLSDTTGWG